MTADKLSSKPENYFVVTEADPILREAISTGKIVRFDSLDETQIDELTSQHGTPNLEYQDSYYRVGYLRGDPPMIYGQIYLVSFFGLVASVFVLICYVSFKELNHVRKQATKSKETKQTPS